MGHAFTGPILDQVLVINSAVGSNVTAVIDFTKLNMTDTRKVGWARGGCVWGVVGGGGGGGTQSRAGLALRAIMLMGCFFCFFLYFLC